MSTKRTLWTLLTTLLALMMLAALAVPTLAGESRPPGVTQDRIMFQEADPADKVRKELEGKGYTVIEVGLDEADELAGVIMEMASFEFDETVRHQIVDGWYALSKNYTDPGIKVYLTGLAYQNRYLLAFMVAPADFKGWIDGKLSDSQFATRYIFKIWDTQTGRWVEDKDFLYKNFGVPMGKTGAAAVGPLPKPVEGSTKAAYEEDFSDPESGWEVEKGAGYSYGYVDGEYFCREEEKNYMVRGSYPQLEFDDFTYQAECRQVEGDPENEYGLIFRQSDKDYYKFGITGDGYYHLSLRKDGAWTKVVDWAESKAIKRGDQVNVLKVVCAGQDISLYINGEHVKTVQDNGLSKGVIGLFAGGWENVPTEARFDNVKVWTGGPGPEPTPTPTTTPTGGLIIGPKTTPTLTAQPTGPRFGPITFSTKVEKGTNKPSDPGTAFPAGINELHATWDYSGMSASNKWTRKWYINGELIIDKTESWAGRDEGRWDNYLFMNSGNPLPEGTYKLEIYIDGKLQQTASCSIGA